MNRATKIWLIIAASLVIVGCIVIIGAMTMLKWDFNKLSTNKYETNSYEVTEVFHSLSVDTYTANVDILLSENEKCSVVCYEHENTRHSVEVKDGILEIEVADMRKWYEHIGVNFATPKITLYVPQGEYAALSVSTDTGKVNVAKDFKFENISISSSTGDITNYASSSDNVTLKASTGKIFVENISAKAIEVSTSTGNINVSSVMCDGNLSVEVSTGKAHLLNVTCKELISDGSTGDIYLTNVVATQKLSIKRDTGDVIFDGADAAEIFVKTDTGDVEGSLLSSKVFFINTDTGKVEVPKLTSGGRCEITTDTGDIKIKVK